MTKTIEDLFVLLGTSTDLIVIVFLLLNYRVLKNEESVKLIIIACSALFALNLTGFLAPTSVKNIVYPAFTLCEFTFVALFLRLHIKSVSFKKFILISILLFYAFVFMEFFFYSLSGVDSIPIAVESIVILIFSFYYLYEQMNEIGTQFIYNRYHFWIVVGLMIYLAGSFFIYVFANQVDQAILQQWWIITVILYIIKNIFFLIAVILLIKEKKNPPRINHTYSPYLN